MGAATPMLLKVGRHPMATVGRAMVRMLAMSAVLREVVSAMWPKITAPIGLVVNPAANTPQYEILWIVSCEDSIYRAEWTYRLVMNVAWLISLQRLIAMQTCLQSAPVRTCNPGLETGKNNAEMVAPKPLYMLKSNHSIAVGRREGSCPSTRLLVLYSQGGLTQWAYTTCPNHQRNEDP